MKTPGATPLKTRLAESVGREEAERFYMLSIAAIESVALEANRFGVEPYWAIAESDQSQHPLWHRVRRLVQPAGDLGSRIAAIYRQLLKRHDVALLIGADAPQIRAETLVEAAELLRVGRETTYVLGPSRDGGFYLFGGRTPISEELWRSVEYSRSTTAKSLAERLRSLGRIERLALLSDVDVEADLEAAATDLRALAGDANAAQQKILHWIESRARRTTSHPAASRMESGE